MSFKREIKKRNTPNQSFVPKLEDLLLTELGIKELNKLAVANPTIWEAFRTKLASHVCKLVLLGKPTEVKEFLEINPQLLFEKGTASDYSGRTIEGSPLQCALGAEDYYSDMLGMMQIYIDKIDSNRDEAKKQICEQFPELYPEFFPEKILELKVPESKEQNVDFHQLIIAVSKEKFDTRKVSDETNLALDHFRRVLEQNDVIKQGKHFNIKILIEAKAIYEKNYDTWNSKQRSFFWREVIGYILRFLPTNYAQAHCNGLKNSCTDISNRSLKLADDTLYFPLDSNNKFRMGVDFAVFSFWQGFPLARLDKAQPMRRSSQYVADKDPLLAILEMKNTLFKLFKTWLKTPTSQPNSDLNRNINKWS